MPRTASAKSRDLTTFSEAGILQLT